MDFLTNPFVYDPADLLTTPLYVRLCGFALCPLDVRPCGFDNYPLHLLPGGLVDLPPQPVALFGDLLTAPCLVAVVDLRPTALAFDPMRSLAGPFTCSPVGLLTGPITRGRVDLSTSPFNRGCVELPTTLPCLQPCGLPLSLKARGSSDHPPSSMTLQIC